MKRGQESQACCPVGRYDVLGTFGEQVFVVARHVFFKIQNSE